uniref:Uncharacterized protein n=1 Tax=Bracon brevicornis TaxID=1563983 RepID=A0A6V7JRD3_9HYME
MPRTKQPRKRNSSLSTSEESVLLIKDFQRQAKARLTKLESDYQMMCTGFSNQIDLTLSKIPPEARQLTLGQLLHFNLEDEDYHDVSSTSDDCPVGVAPPPPSTVKKPMKRQTAASMDDGYVTESRNSQQQRISRADKVTSTSQKPRKSRSTSRTTHKTRVSSDRRGTSTSRMNNRFLTPSVQKPATEFQPVTPKIKPNTPLNVLRRPRDGEMVLSMQGSPILVSAIVRERTANINVPLGNGTIISLLPDGGLRRSQIPHLDPETVKQLQTLKGHIEKVIDRH